MTDHRSDPHSTDHRSTDHRREQSGPAGVVHRPAGVVRRRALTVSVVVLAGLQASTGVVAAQGGERAVGEGLRWQLCSTVKAGWPIKNDTRSECAELSVPMDYARPEGRKITIAVSRVRATQPKASAAPLVSVLGGPGFSNISDPATMTQRGLAALNSDRDFIGLDLRGTGYSDGIPCDQKPGPEPAPTTPEKKIQKAFFDHQAEYNTRCAAIDPGFVRQITPENAARDIDRFRAALGAEKINFYGASFGTAIGMAYRALFDRRTERMWLDSPVPPTRHLPTMEGDMESGSAQESAPFVKWLAQRDAEHQWGADEATVRGRLGELRGRLEKRPRTGDGVLINGRWVLDQVFRPQEEWDDAAKNLAAVRNGATPSVPPAAPAARAPQAPPSATAGATPERPLPLRTGNPSYLSNTLQWYAMFCNTDLASRGFAGLWATRETRRAADPLTGGTHFSSPCAKWPLKAPAARPAQGNSALQISGHLYEGVTPYLWAEQARDATGGTLFTILNSGHADLPFTSCAEKAVTFFRTGHKAEGTCGGERQP
ncbi:alpha/beta fold hydrolase [Streptomyces sp. NPDC000594]|uniref:alpha/beta fold hydrolase n=1 Tax=Streptomyces sp. NPDC000594 TaxID=3154261 RepID=UPI00332D6B57